MKHKQERWVAKVTSGPDFYRGILEDSSREAFVEIKTDRLEQYKLSNPKKEIPGVEFRLVVE